MRHGVGALRARGEAWGSWKRLGSESTFGTCFACLYGPFLLFLAANPWEEKRVLTELRVSWPPRRTKSSAVVKVKVLVGFRSFQRVL